MKFVHKLCVPLRATPRMRAYSQKPGACARAFFAALGGCAPPWQSIICFRHAAKLLLCAVDAVLQRMFHTVMFLGALAIVKPVQRAH